MLNKEYFAERKQKLEEGYSSAKERFIEGVLKLTDDYKAQRDLIRSQYQDVANLERVFTQALAQEQKQKEAAAEEKAKASQKAKKPKKPLTQEKPTNGQAN